MRAIMLCYKHNSMRSGPTHPLPYHHQTWVFSFPLLFKVRAPVFWYILMWDILVVEILALNLVKSIIVLLERIISKIRGREAWLKTSPLLTKRVTGTSTRSQLA